MHDGAKLAALIEWADRNFDKFIITLSDTLYRYNLMAEGVSEAQAYMTSLKMGELWLADNHKTLLHRPYHKPCIIQRWDEWLSHSEYEKVYQDIQNLYQEDALFKNALDTDVDNFVRRQPVADIEIYNRIKETSRLFLMEECAVYILIARTHRALRVYPAKDMECFKFLRLDPSLPKSLQGLSLAAHLDINFKRKGVTSEKIAA